MLGACIPIDAYIVTDNDVTSETTAGVISLLFSKLGADIKNDFVLNQRSFGPFLISATDLFPPLQTNLILSCRPSEPRDRSCNVC